MEDVALDNDRTYRLQQEARIEQLTTERDEARNERDEALNERDEARNQERKVWR